MEMKELERLMHEFVSSKGWYDEASPRQQTLRNLAASLSIEASEVLEHFQWEESPVNVDDLTAELADVALYLLQLASVTGIDLEEAILKKLDTNSRRSW